MRGIISWILFFSAGVICAGSYFYRLHPEHEPEADLPRARNELDELVERGKRLKRAWDGDNQAENEDERFDIDFTLMTGEVARLLDDLLAALGGEQPA